MILIDNKHCCDDDDDDCSNNNNNNNNFVLLAQISLTIFRHLLNHLSLP